MNAIRTKYDIKQTDNDLLFQIAKNRIENFSYLRDIYNDDFLRILINFKNENDNILLFWLVTEEPSALAYLQKINQNIQNIGSSRSHSIYKRKLKQWNNIAFDSAITELEIISEFINKGYEIELEPTLPTNRYADFAIIKNSIKIYFELKNVTSKRFINENAIIDKFREEFRELEKPFLVSLTIENDFQLKQVDKAIEYVKAKLADLDQHTITIPCSFEYVVKNKILLKVDIIHILSDGGPGFISGFIYGGGVKTDWGNLRKTILRAKENLHPDYPGVILLKSLDMGIMQFDIENAVLGDLRVNMLSEPRLFRSGESIFSLNINNQISAIVFYRHDKKYVYHNPFSHYNISEEIFAGDNVIQYIPEKLEDGKIYYKQIMMEEISKLSSDTKEIVSRKLKQIIDEELSKNDGE